MRREPRVIAPRVPNAYLDVVAKQKPRGEPWDSNDSDSEDSSQANSNNESSESTKIFFFSEAHAGRALDTIDDGVIDGVDAIVPGEDETPKPEQLDQALDMETCAAAHEDSRCIACVAFLIDQTCRLGDDCRFCHLSHSGTTNREERRPTKEMRVKCKNAINRIQENVHDKQSMLEELQNLLTTQSHSARKYTIKLLNDTKWREVGDASAHLSSATGAQNSHDGKACGIGPSVIPPTSFAVSTEGGKGPREVPPPCQLASTTLSEDMWTGPAYLCEAAQTLAANKGGKEKHKGYESFANVGPRKGKSKGSKDNWKGRTATFSL